MLPNCKQFSPAGSQHKQSTYHIPLPLPHIRPGKKTENPLNEKSLKPSKKKCTVEAFRATIKPSRVFSESSQNLYVSDGLNYTHSSGEMSCFAGNTSCAYSSCDTLLVIFTRADPITATDIPTEVNNVVLRHTKMRKTVESLKYYGANSTEKAYQCYKRLLPNYDYLNFLSANKVFEPANHALLVTDKCCLGG